jgi:hypothetical protein
MPIFQFWWQRYQIDQEKGSHTSNDEKKINASLHELSSRHTSSSEFRNENRIDIDF